MIAAAPCSSSPRSRAILSVRNLHLAIAGRRRHTPILRGVSLDIAPGEVHGLVGESGAGKTMIGKVILGIQPSTARIVRGSVVFDGRDITHLDEADRRRLMGRGLGLIPQDPMTSLNPAYRIGGQIADVLRLHLGMERAAAGARARELLDDVHIRARCARHRATGDRSARSSPLSRIASRSGGNGPEGERTQEGASRYLNLERPDDDALVRLEPTNSLRTVRLGATRIAVLKRRVVPFSAQRSAQSRWNPIPSGGGSCARDSRCRQISSEKA